MRHLFILLSLFVGTMCYAQNDDCIKKIPIYECNEKSLLDLIDTLITTEAHLGIITDQLKYNIRISVYDISAGCFFSIFRDSTILQLEDTCTHLNTYGCFEYKGNNVLVCLGRYPGSIMSLGCISPTNKYLNVKCHVPDFFDFEIDDTDIEIPHIEIWGNINNGKVLNYEKRKY